MTIYNEKCNECYADFSNLLNRYGMTAKRSTSASYPNANDLSVIATTFYSDCIPVKDNKALIQELINSGFHVEKYKTYEKYYVFYVTKTYRIDLSK